MAKKDNQEPYEAHYRQPYSRSDYELFSKVVDGVWLRG